MKILLFIDSFGFNKIGGARRVLYETCLEFNALGHQTDVICKDDGISSVSPTTLPHQINFITYKDIEGSELKKFIHYVKSIKICLKKYLKTNTPDLIIINSSSAVFGVIRTIAKLKTPKIYVFHSPWSAEYESQNEKKLASGSLIQKTTAKTFSFLRNMHERSCLKICNEILTLSQYMRKMFLLHHPNLATKPFIIVPGAANHKKFFPPSDENQRRLIREKLALPQEKTIVLTVRRLVDRTGIDVLIRAYSKIFHSLKRESILLIVGDGPKAPQYKKLAEESGCAKHILFTGNVDDNILPDYYRATDIFVMPTKALEGFGLSTVEALSSGLPVIGTNVGATPEILEKISNELIIGPCTEKAIAAKLADTIDNVEKFREKFCEASAKFAKENFSWEKHAKTIINH